MNVVFSSKSLGLFCGLLCFCLSSTIAQRDFSKVEIEAEKITPSVYMLTGSGGNIGLCVGKDGIFMIDDQYAPLSEKIMTKIASIQEGGVKYLVNTHWHGDHAGGNENFGNAGALIVAHENVRKRLSKDQLMKAFSRTVPAAPEAAWPDITFTKELSFHLNGEDIMMLHVHNAHTDGDAFVYFAQSNVLHMGDTYFKGRYPFIDLSSGGSIDGIIKAANQALFIINEETVIIPGHGTLSNKKELREYRDVLMVVRDRIKKAIKEGKSLDDIKAAKLNSDYDETWGSGFIDPDRIVDIIYTDLTREE